jgi:hypothetical protein
MDQETFRFKPRNYLHFDLPLSREAAWLLASEPKRVATHSFYPFIGFTIRTPRIKWVDGVMTKKDKNREIKIAAHADAAIYSLYGQALGERYEEFVTANGIEHAVTAFRRLPGGGTNVDFAGDVFQFIRANRPCEAMAYDVEGFFDNLDHDLLRAEWRRVLGVSRLPTDQFAVFRSLTKFSWVERANAFRAFDINPNKPKAGQRTRICTPKQFRDSIRAANLLRENPRGAKGIPQGSPMSAVLSNIYMIPFDLAVSNYVKSLGGLYKRYCDDIMVVVRQEHAAAVDKFLNAQIELRRLTFHEGKTDRVIFDNDPASRTTKALQYLGFTFDGLKVLLRISSLSRYYGKMRRGVRLAKQTQRKHNRREAKNGEPLSALRRRKLYLQYSYLYESRRKPANRDSKSNGNFLTYAYKASRKLASKDIKFQVRGHWKKLLREIQKPIINQLRAP